MAITTTPSGGPQGEFSTYTPIYSTTISSAVDSVTLSNIPTTFTDLTISLEVQLASSGEDLYVRFNGDSGSNYSTTWLRGISNAASSLRQSSTGCRLSDGGSSTNGNTTQQTINIQNYSNATTFKTTLSRSNNASRGLDAMVNLWRSTSAVTSLTFYTSAGNISSGTITIYGIKAAVSAPKAAGGDLVYSDSLYWYHVFNNSGAFVPYTSLTCDYLVVAGGGGSSNGTGGGGGGGGYRTSIGGSQTTLVSQTSYTVTVGAGGTGSTGGTQTKGVDSSMLIAGSTTITSTGGGYGGSFGIVGGPGGSGGGGGYFQSGATNGYPGAGNTPSTSPSQGNSGGSGREGAPNYGSGGGGGAGAVGGDANTSQSGNGGAGALSAITGLYYAGGGGGGSDSSRANVAGTGGVGGGGNGAISALRGVAGTANTGGGAGGGAGGLGNNGGSGVVIVRYLG
jgi:hypothetical protein